MSTLAQWRDQLFYQPLSLGIIALVTCAALVFANQATHSAIIAAEERDLQNSLSEVLPAGHAQGYDHCFEAFVADTYRAIEGEQPHGLPTFEDGLRSARIVDHVVTSARTRAWTTIG